MHVVILMQLYSVVFPLLYSPAVVHAVGDAISDSTEGKKMVSGGRLLWGCGGRCVGVGVEDEGEKGGWVWGRGLGSLSR